MLLRKEVSLAGLRCTNLPSHPPEFPDVISVTLGELQPLILPLKAAFQAHMAVWRLVDHATIEHLAFPVCLWHNGCNADGADGQRAYICRG